MFISSSEDKTGILDLIEKKLEKATMIPRSHGEVLITHYSLQFRKFHIKLIQKFVSFFSHSMF